MLPPGQISSFAREFSKLAALESLDESRLQRGDVLSITLGKRISKILPARAAEEAFRRGSQAVQGSYTHSALYVGDGELVEARVGEGVTKKSLEDAVGKLSFTVHRPKLKKSDREEAARFAEKQVGKGYDTVALVTTAGGTVLPEKVVKLIDKKVISAPKGSKKYTCSNLVVAAYDKAQLTPAGSLASPGDLRSSKKMELVTKVHRKGFKESGPAVGRIRGRWRQREKA
jgi:uncharacterized protein YycO